MRHTTRYLGIVLVAMLAVGVVTALAYSHHTGGRGGGQLLGEVSRGARGSTLAPDGVIATRVKAGRSVDGSRIRLYVRRAQRRSRLLVGLYSDDHGRPARRLAEGEVTQPEAQAWNATSVMRAQLERGRHYWLVVLARGGAVALASGRVCSSGASQPSDALPGRWAARPPASCPLSLYGSGVPVTSTAMPARSTSTVASSTSAASRTTRCFSSPGACGYPDPAYGNVGVRDCSALRPFRLSDLPRRDYYYSGTGSVVEVIANDVTIKGYDISGYEFDIAGVTGTVFDRDCLSTSPSGGSGGAIYDASNGTTSGSHTTVEHSTIDSPACAVAAARNSQCSAAGINAIDIAGGPRTVIDHDILVGAVENVNGLGAGSVVENSYIVANGYAPSAHTEDIYAGTGTDDLRIDHNTLLNPFDETAVVFVDNGSGPCQSNGISLTNNLMAGGGYLIYGCSGATSLGSNTFTFEDNDVARCGARGRYDPATGGRQCGRTRVVGNPGTAYGAGGDSDGFWPRAGYYGLATDVFCHAAGTTWSGNRWDASGRPIACP